MTIRAQNLLTAFACLTVILSGSAQVTSTVEVPVQPVAMGDYEPVLNWPKPLPDRDLLTF